VDVTSHSPVAELSKAVYGNPSLLKKARFLCSALLTKTLKSRSSIAVNVYFHFSAISDPIAEPILRRVDAVHDSFEDWKERGLKRNLRRPDAAHDIDMHLVRGGISSGHLRDVHVGHIGGRMLPRSVPSLNFGSAPTAGAGWTTRDLLVRHRLRIYWLCVQLQPGCPIPCRPESNVAVPLISRLPATPLGIDIALC
jgi:hypothetical protein